MTISNMKPSPNLLPRDAKILARLPDIVDRAYADADRTDALIMREECGNPFSSPLSRERHRQRIQQRLSDERDDLEEESLQREHDEWLELSADY